MMVREDVEMSVTMLFVYPRLRESGWVAPEDKRTQGLFVLSCLSEPQCTLLLLLLGANNYRLRSVIRKAEMQNVPKSETF